MFGFFAAVILGAVLSTFNSVLNSASTVFCYDIYKKSFNKNVSDAKLVRYGKIVSVVLAVISITVAPLVAYAPDGLYFLLQELNGIFFIPISSVIIAGIFIKQINAIGAKAGLFFGFTFYILATFVIKVDIHFVHLWGIEFVLNFIIMFIFSKVYARRVTPVEIAYNSADKSWSLVNVMGVILVLATVLIYVLLS